MNVSFAIIVVLTGVLLVVAYQRGGVSLAASGLREGAGLLVSVGPQILLGFVLAGLVTVLVPTELIASTVGTDSGMRGLVIATVAGIITPGGPFLQFPLVAAIFNGGAAIGPVAAYLTAWSLISANRALVWEVPVLGLPFTVARWAVSLVVPIAVGLTLPLALRLMGRP